MNTSENTNNSNTPSWFDLKYYPHPDDKVELSEREWKERLRGNEYRIMRTEGTEPPFHNEYYHTRTEGVYICRACSNPLFSSDTKYESGTGWPSFFAPLSTDRIETKTDHKLAEERTEVHCARCGAHMGHVFDDGPQPTGLRYCINSPSLRLIDKSTHEKIAKGSKDELGFTIFR